MLRPMLSLAVLCALVTTAPMSNAEDIQVYSPSAQEMRDTWLLDGSAEIEVMGERWISLVAGGNAEFSFWTPVVFEGPVEVSFEAMIPDEKTKVLLLLCAHGAEDRPIWSWERTDSYDELNCGPMELYTIAFNRGAHTAVRAGDELANVRRIGGPRFAFYSPEARKAMSRVELADAWQRWNSLSLLGAAREPESGPGRWLSYCVNLNPPHITMDVNGVKFLEVVDHSPEPLRKGAVGFRCMSRGKRLDLRNVVIKGRVVSRKSPDPPKNEVVYEQNFDALPAGERLPDGWWVEGTERVWIEGGRLHMRANAQGEPAADRSNISGFAGTVWTDCILSGDVTVEVDACVLASHKGVNNINLFLFYSDPSGKRLEETRAARASGDYRLYHDLSGYIVTFLQDWPEERKTDADGNPLARIRIRRCPGFRLISERHAYHCREGTTYHIAFTKVDGKLIFSVDGNVLAETVDAEPLSEGRLGFRTFRTYLWWDNLKVTRPRRVSHAP